MKAILQAVFYMIGYLGIGWLMNIESRSQEHLQLVFFAFLIICKIDQVQDKLDKLLKKQ